MRYGARGVLNMPLRLGAGLGARRSMQRRKAHGNPELVHTADILYLIPWTIGFV